MINTMHITRLHPLTVPDEVLIREEEEFDIETEVRNYLRKHKKGRFDSAL